MNMKQAMEKAFAKVLGTKIHPKIRRKSWPEDFRVFLHIEPDGSVSFIRPGSGKRWYPRKEDQDTDDWEVAK
tara:strand:- start:39 stop:254 length:216 start_codon:yes stop_codon:yes gene_type:complete